MAKYAIFFRFNSGTVKGLMEHPSDRAAAVSKLCESAGGRMESYYWMLGDWDGFTVVDGVDSKGAAALSLSVTSTGAFAALATHELFEAGDVGGILETAKGLTYSPPGS